MTKQEIRAWRRAIWRAVLETPPPENTYFYDLWYGALIDEGK